MPDEKPIQVGIEATLTRIRVAGARARTGLRTALARVAHAARGRPWIAVAVAAAVLAGGLGAAVALTQPGDSAFLDAIRPQRADLRALARRARQQPRSAAAWKGYGQALFAAGQRRGGVRAYGRALALDAGSADGAMADDLLSCFGRREQRRAEALLVRYRMARAAGGLQKLARDARRPVRWGAVRTLERLGRADREDYLQAWVLDLDSPDCGVRRHAAARLGEAGDRAALDKLRAAKRKEDQRGSACLGDRAEKAEKRILARR